MKHLLIVEDDQFMAELYKNKFEAAGYRVSVAYSGQTAVEKLDDTPPDVILLDLMLPGVNGVGLLDFIRSSPDLRELPVIVVSTCSYFSGMVQAALTAGATQFVNKEDCDLTKLVSLVNEMLSPPPPAAPPPIPPDIPRTGSPPNILIADDDKIIHGILKFFLEQAGCSITSVFDGGQAVESALASPPDLMILDVLMPVMDGFQVMQQWSDHPALRKIPVVMLTGLDDGEIKPEMAKSGVVASLKKPLSPDSVVKTVMALLNSRPPS